MRLTYGKFVRSLYLLLFTVSSIVCFFKYHTNAGLIAILSLIGFIAFDIICQLKKKDVPDFSKEIAELKEQNSQLNKDFQDIKANISIGAMAAAIKRK